MTITLELPTQVVEHLNENPDAMEWAKRMLTDAFGDVPEEDDYANDPEEYAKTIEAIRRGLEDIKEGRHMSLEEAKAYTRAEVTRRWNERKRESEVVPIG